MRASELIKQLQKMIDTYGDIVVEVPVPGDFEHDVVGDVRTYTYNLGTTYNYTAILLDPAPFQYKENK